MILEQTAKSQGYWRSSLSLGLQRQQVGLAKRQEVGLILILLHLVLGLLSFSHLVHSFPFQNLYLFSLLDGFLILYEF